MEKENNRKMEHKNYFERPGKVIEAGVLYAHVDDSFVRAYDLRADNLKSLLPK
jgi:hypothetical protein